MFPTLDVLDCWWFKTFCQAPRMYWCVGREESAENGENPRVEQEGKHEFMPIYFYLSISHWRVWSSRMNPYMDQCEQGWVDGHGFPFLCFFSITHPFPTQGTYLQIVGQTHSTCYLFNSCICNKTWLLLTLFWFWRWLSQCASPTLSVAHGWWTAETQLKDCINMLWEHTRE